MKVNHSGNLKIAEYKTRDEYEQDRNAGNKYDLVIIDETVPELPLYPTKIAFQVNIEVDSEDYISSFSSSKRSSIRKRLRDTASKFSVKFAETINREDYMQWKAGYDKFIAGLDDGNNKISDDWFSTKAVKHIAILFFDKGGAMHGGAMVKKFASKMSMSYAWYSDELKKTGGATKVLIDLVEYCFRKKIPTLSFGQDTNLFGGHLSIGLHEYKRSWQTYPVITKAAEMKSIIVGANPSSEILFYTLENNHLIEQRIVSEDKN